MDGLINYNIVKPELANAFAMGMEESQRARNELARQRQAQQMADIQLQNAMREQRLAGEEEAAYKVAGGDLARLQTELAQRGLGKQSLAVGAQMQTQQANRIKMLKDANDLKKSVANAIFANPNFESAVAATQEFGQRTGLDISADLQQLQKIGNNPEGIRQWAAGHALEADKLLPKFESMNLTGGVSRQGFSPVTGAPVGPATFTPVVPLPPEVEAQKARIALAGRAPAQPVAPTITQIQDPTNPAQMITIDARRYQGGGVGAPGVIGTTGKAAPVAAAEQKRAEGAQQAQDILDVLKTAYDELDRMRAVPSEERGVISNAMAYVAGTGAGQIAGRVAGTKEQTQRDVISSARNQMLNAIKNATGMSAQQLNSNVEFRSWLEALTDPTRSIEANRSILENMEKFIASGGKYSARKNPSAPPPAAGANPPADPLGIR